MVSAATAVLALASPAAAQDEFLFNDIPWGISLAETTDALAPLGFVLNTEFTPDEGEVMYEHEDDSVLLASFAGDVLVGIRVAIGGSPEDVAAMFDESVREGTANLGQPELPQEGVATWRRGETTFTLMRGRSEHGMSFLTVAYAGPGFEAEIQRRLARMAPRELPELDPRWTVISEGGERRISFDHTTVRAAGGRVLRVWVRNDYAAPATDDGMTFDRTLDQIEYDCGQLRFRVLASTYQMGEQVVGTHTGDAPSDWVSIVPETIGETIIAAVCAQPSPKRGA